MLTYDDALGVVEQAEASFLTAFHQIRSLHVAEGAATSNCGDDGGAAAPGNSCS